MSRHNNKNRKNIRRENQREGGKKITKGLMVEIPEAIKKWIGGVVLILFAIISVLSFFNLAGIAGQIILTGLRFLAGKAVYIIPLVLTLGGIICVRTAYRRFVIPLALAAFLVIFAVSGIFGVLAVEKGKASIDLIKTDGGIIGYVFGFGFFKLFGFLVSQIIFSALMIIGLIIFEQLFVHADKERGEKKGDIKEDKETQDKETSPSIVKKIFPLRLKVKQLEPLPDIKQVKTENTVATAQKSKSVEESPVVSTYKLPPINLLEPDKENPSSGDIQANTTIIQKTLQNFDIPVEMGEVNVGPTVTQYTLKPTEGVRLSKITALSNDLSLSLAAHPLRIEAPIPGRSLVGIEIPNKIRARVRLRNMIEAPNYQNSPARLLIGLGRDVSGQPIYTDLARMPHMLVAGATGTGKTIFLNSLIMSLLYKNSPDYLRLVMVDPKRVEFQVYHDIPHLLSPVIFDAVSTCNALRWLIGEMERRFGVLAGVKVRDIIGYNEIMTKNREKIAKKPRKIKEQIDADDVEEEYKPMPYIVLIIDELADLMSAKGREVEGNIVRLAQMARAVGIHLVLATQRPSVEVITGLIKANITARVTFQVASQIDSRTILDTAGAEKLLGFGDLLFISAEVSKPKRVQGAYVSEKEVKDVVEFIKTQVPDSEPLLTDLQQPTEEETNDPPSLASLSTSLAKALEAPEEIKGLNGENDSLYEEARRIVIEAKKASASLLQRRLRVGYARAARLIDLLEERGVVGPGDGAKPREILVLPSNGGHMEEIEVDGEEGIDEDEDEKKSNNWEQL
ncbi:MAG: DNA translocase FtsK 4TM domain-containing protein [bacterium]